MTQMLTPDEVARALGIPTSRLARWRASSPSRGPRWVKLGRDVRYRREDLDAWIAAAAAAAVNTGDELLKDSSHAEVAK